MLWQNPNSTDGSITDVPGIKVGHATDPVGLTGCTVVLCEKGAVGGVDVRGGAPGTRETDLLRPAALVERVHAVMLAGGSAYGLAAAEGVMRYLSEKSVGFDTGAGVVPIVPAAVLFDLFLGDPRAFPDAGLGYRACLEASGAAVPEGNVGAGTGASAGKLLGPCQATKTGVGSASLRLPGGAVVGALAAVNSFGDVMDPYSGRIVAGTRCPLTGHYVDTAARLLQLPGGWPWGFGNNTTLGVVATNARLTKAGACKLASLAQNGLARVLSPAHSMVDGDTVFVLGTGEVECDLIRLGVAASEAMIRAVLRAARSATEAGGIPAASSVPGETAASRGAHEG